MLYEEDMSVLSKVRRFIRNITEVIPGVFQVTHRGANVLIILEEKITIIDTGLREGAGTVLDFITRAGRSHDDVGLIVMTHNHIDHMGGLHEIRKHTSNAVVAIHRDDIGEREHPPSADARYKEPLAEVRTKLRSMFSVLSEDVDMVLEGGETLDCLGGLEVIHTPGHTWGSISLYARQHKMMITGDLIRKHRKMLYLPPKMVSASLEDNLESVKIVAGYDIETICFGHGLPLYDDIQPRLQALLERGLE